MLTIRLQGFRQICLTGGVQKGCGVWGRSPRRKKSRVFKFWFLKWPILTEITVKYFNFSCQQGGDIPPCGAKWGGPDPPWRKPWPADHDKSHF